MKLTDKSLESFLKNKLDSYEPEYNHSDWVRLEKDLPAAKTGISGLTSKIISIAGVVAVTVATIAIVNLYKTNSTEPNQNIAITNDSNKPVIEKSVATIDVAKSTSNKISAVSKDVSDKENNLDKEISNNSTTQSENSDVITEVSSEKKLPEPNNTNSIAKQVPIAINNNIAQPVASFTCSVLEGCSPLKVSFIPEVLNDSLLYIWTFGDGNISYEMSPTHTYSNEISAIPSLTVKYKKSKLSKTSSGEVITVKQSPKAEFAFENTGANFNFECRTLSAMKCKWLFGNGEESSEKNPVVSFSKNGKYPVSLNVISANGCSDAVTKDVVSQIKFNIMFPNAFIPNGNGRNDMFGAFGDNLSDYQVSIAIYSRNGQLVFESNDVNEKWNGKIKGTDRVCEPGTYGYEVFIKDKAGNMEKRIGSVVLLNK